MKTQTVIATARYWILGLILVAVATSEVQSGYLFTGCTNNLVRIDTDQGDATVIGQGEANIMGLAYNGKTEVMYVLDGGYGGGVYAVDLTTGHTSLAVRTRHDRWGATFSADFSVLYSVAPGQYGVDLLKIDPATGASVSVGTTGIVGSTIEDLTLDSHNVLYAGTDRGDIYTLDQATGDATFVVSTGPGVLVGISFDAADNLFGIVQNPWGGISTWLVGIDLATGTTTQIGGILPLYSYRGLEFLRDYDPDAPPPPGGGVPGGGGNEFVPEASSLFVWSGLCIVGVGYGWWRKRREH